ncbi:hypothetical protein PhCBS80983_g04786 [Powellomyces hirtus]|uniref:Protein farnesyltransferase/geranylgeranyltransferase type-1 subunit alpha n=1 Tax=Powellomyces hirtus TaxID=109895 RepID=A0A507DXB7_9FUNG|nr:hypothetical protein PhCBS80983_g04786 [Powellomyces hirtus]
MSSDDDDDLLFSDRPEWADVTPVPQDDGPNPLVPIAYAPNYADAMSYFRAVLATTDRSKRVLDLTEFIVRLNPGHYSVWKYRQDTVFALSADLTSELDFIEEMAEDQPKSYQIWHYRQAMVAHLSDASREIPFINRMLAIDSKNYHAWSYRQWVVYTFALWDKEFSDIDRLLEVDVRNNSAWNQRFWVFKNRPEGFEGGELEKEVEYVVKRILLAPRNESPWAYLRGIVALAGKTLADIPAIADLCASLRDTASNTSSTDVSPHALAMQLDIAVAKQNTAECKTICSLLIQQDPIRAKYWHYRLTLVA